MFFKKKVTRDVIIKDMKEVHNKLKQELSYPENLQNEELISLHQFQLRFLHTLLNGRFKNLN